MNMFVKVGVCCAVAFAIGTGFHSQLTSLQRSMHLSKPQRLDLPDGLDKRGWKIAFDDEFTQDRTLDPAKWITSLDHNQRTHGSPPIPEMQYYTDDSVRLDDGHLKLIADRRMEGGKPYTSGIVCSAGKFEQEYGLFEIRCKLPLGKGFWPAFWLKSRRGWPPEIDVFEAVGQHPGVVVHTNHWTEPTGRHKYHKDEYTGINTTDGFHTYSVDWEPDSITWYVDGVQTARHVDNVPSTPLYMIANLAVGGRWPGPPDDATQFPSSMDIDWIRVYQRESP
jgi:beta-glucanase (GH16 family)